MCCNITLITLAFWRVNRGRHRFLSVAYKTISYNVASQVSETSGVFKAVYIITRNEIILKPDYSCFTEYHTNVDTQIVLVYVKYT